MIINFSTEYDTGCNRSTKKCTQGRIIHLVFARQYTGDLDNVNNMNGECSTHGKDEIHIKNLNLKKVKQNYRKGRRRITLKLISENGAKAGNGFKRLRLGSDDEVL